MTKERELSIADCKEMLIRLESWIALDKFVRHQNGSIEVEYVLESILNLVYGWQLKNANDLFGRCQDSFDLADEQNGIAVQVTVTDGAEKIRQTLRQFIGKHDRRFKRLVFVYPKVSPSVSKADFSSELNGFDFDASRDRLGLGAILSAAQPSQLNSLRELLRRELGTLAVPSPAQQSQNVIIADTVIARHGVLMHSPSAGAKPESPTLIVSAYARPLPDDLQTVPRYPSTSWASDSEFTSLPLFYASKRDGERISISPVNPYVSAIRDGGPLHTISSADPWYGVFHFPTLDVKLVNNTESTVFFHEAEFRVASSKSDCSAVPALIGPQGSLYVSICNLGWGVLKDAVLRFALAPIAEELLEDAPLKLPEHLPHVMELGTFDSSRTFTLLPFFQIEGIDTNRVADLLDTHWDSDEQTVRLRRELEFFYETRDSDDEDRYVHTRELPRRDYELFLKQAAGRFYNARPSMVGVLEYDEVSTDGTLTHRAVSLFALLDFARHGLGAGAPPSNEYHIKLECEQDNYVRTLQLSQALRAGETDRFLIQVAADRSSIHDFIFALRFNNDQVVEAPIRLELFCSQMDSHFASAREFSQTT